MANDIGPIVKADPRIVKLVLEKIASGQEATKRKSGGGRQPRIKPGTAKADVLVGALRSGLGSRHTASKINALGVSPGKKPISGRSVRRLAQSSFGMKRGKRAIIKTGSRDKTSSWSTSRLAICKQFLKDLEEGVSSLEGTLFVDEHSEFCVLGHGAHHGQSIHHEWRAPLDAAGNWCLEKDGGVLEPTKPITNPKNAKRADGAFGVCAPTPNGKQREGRKMIPIRYLGKVVGTAAWHTALQKHIGAA